MYTELTGSGLDHVSAAAIHGQRLQIGKPVTRVSTLRTELNLIDRPMRHNPAGNPDTRFNRCLYAAAEEALLASGHPSAEPGNIAWLHDGYPDAWTFLFVITMWVDEEPVSLHLTAHHDEVMFFFIPEDYEDHFPPHA